MNTRCRFFKRLHALRLAALLGLIAGGLCAAASAATEPVLADLSASNRFALSDCTRLALAQNPLLKATTQDQAVARETVGEARASYYPTLGVRGGVSRWQSHAFLPRGIIAPNLSSTVGPTDDWSVGGFARYMLYDGGVRRAALDMARVGESASAEDADAIRLMVLFDVHQAFFQLATALELRAVAAKSQANAQSHFADARSRQAAGDTTEADVLRARVEVDNAQSELISIDTLIGTARGDLNIAMGLPAELPLDIVSDDTAESCSNEVSVTGLVAEALATRPEIKAMQSAVEQAQHRVLAAKAAFGPKVYAEGNYGWRDDSASLDDQAWSVGVTVELTAFEGFSKRHALARTRAETAKAEAMLERTTLAVRREVWTAYARVQESDALVHATATQAQHAEESLRLMAARYKVGAVTMTDLLDAQTSLTAAEVRHVQARWGCRQAQSSLRRATGTLTEEE